AARGCPAAPPRPTALARCNSSARTFLQDERRRAAHPRRMARQGVFLPPDGGRSHPMGRISSRFLANILRWEVAMQGIWFGLILGGLMVASGALAVPMMSAAV